MELTKEEIETIKEALMISIDTFKRWSKEYLNDEPEKIVFSAKSSGYEALLEMFEKNNYTESNNVICNKK